MSRSTPSFEADPETALPLIIGSMLPIGLVGFMLAALLSGFLATFSSTVNGGAAYLVKDVYQRYINPDADAKKLVRVSYFSSALLIIIGLIISVFGTSINTAFLWIFGTLAAGILPPNVLRWYWWRLNGQGYAAGVFGGMALSLGQVVLDTTVFADSRFRSISDSRSSRLPRRLSPSSFRYADPADRYRNPQEFLPQGAAGRLLAAGKSRRACGRHPISKNSRRLCVDAVQYGHRYDRDHGAVCFDALSDPAPAGRSVSGCSRRRLFAL